MKTKRMVGVVLAALIGGFCLLLGGCASKVDNAPGVAIPAGAEKRQAQKNLAPGDVISVAFPAAPEFNTQQKIRPDGRVSLPMVGDVSAEGQSLASFQSGLIRRYDKSLQDPQVVVSLLATSAAVYVTGAVNAPNKIPLDRPMTAFQAVMESGGFSPIANPKKVAVIRNVNGQHQRYNLDMTGALTGRTKAFYLQPDDTVYVGQRQW